MSFDATHTVSTSKFQYGIAAQRIDEDGSNCAARNSGTDSKCHSLDFNHFVGSRHSVRGLQGHVTPRKKVLKVSAKRTRAVSVEFLTARKIGSANFIQQCAECHESHRRCSGGTPCRQCAEKAKRGSICRCHYPPRRTRRVVGEALTSVPESDNLIPSLGGESTYVMRNTYTCFY